MPDPKWIEKHIRAGGIRPENAGKPGTSFLEGVPAPPMLPPLHVDPDDPIPSIVRGLKAVGDHAEAHGQWLAEHKERLDRYFRIMDGVDDAEHDPGSGTDHGAGEGAAARPEGRLAEGRRTQQ